MTPEHQDIINAGYRSAGIKKPEAADIFWPHLLSDMDATQLKRAVYASIANQRPMDPGYIVGWTDESQDIAANKIVQEVASNSGVSIAQIMGKTRKAKFVRSRQLVMYLIRKRLSWPYAQIGRLIGNRDHTTVLHGVRNMQANGWRYFPEYFGAKQ